MGVYFVYAFFVFIAIAIALTVWNDWKEGKLMKKEFEQKQALIALQQKAPVSTNPPGKAVGARDLFLDTLTKIGCQYQLGEGEDNRIFFAYQGEHFFGDLHFRQDQLHPFVVHAGPQRNKGLCFPAQFRKTPSVLGIDRNDGNEGNVIECIGIGISPDGRQRQTVLTVAF